MSIRQQLYHHPALRRTREHAHAQTAQRRGEHDERLASLQQLQHAPVEYDDPSTQAFHEAMHQQRLGRRQRAAHEAQYNRERAEDAEAALVDQQRRVAVLVQRRARNNEHPPWR